MRRQRETAGALARPAPGADRRHRGLHQRRQVVAAQRADRQRGCARPRTGSSPRSTRRAGRSSWATARSVVADRHGGLHPQAAAPARRRLPGHARGGQPGRRAARGRRACRRARPRAPPDGPAVLDELGAGEKPRLVGYNKADLVDAGRADGDGPGAGRSADSVLVSALTGYGMDTLRAAARDAPRRPVGGGRRRAAVQRGRAAVARPRARHGRDRATARGTCASRGRVAPQLAGELRAAEARARSAATAPR